MPWQSTRVVFLHMCILRRTGRIQKPPLEASGLTTEDQIIKYWQGQSTFVDGLSQETCRDFTHTGYGISSISHVAETARIQGTDLYTGDTGTRLRYALGFHSLYALGAAVPSWLCNGVIKKGLGPSEYMLLALPPP